MGIIERRRGALKTPGLELEFRAKLSFFRYIVMRYRKHERKVIDVKHACRFPDI